MRSLLYLPLAALLGCAAQADDSVLPCTAASPCLQAAVFECDEGDEAEAPEGAILIMATSTGEASSHPMLLATITDGLFLTGGSDCHDGEDRMVYAYLIIDAD